MKGSKGVLRRMPRVRSDEMHEAAAEKEQQPPQQQQHQHQEKEKTPSPIGAGLPLLQRLRLLKEKQVSRQISIFSSLLLIIVINCIHVELLATN